MYSSKSLPGYCAWYLTVQLSVSFTGEFLSNFDLKNMILTYIKDFSWEKNDTNLSDFSVLFFPSNCQILMMNSSM